MLRTTKEVATFHATDPESGRTRTIDRMDHLSVRQVVHVVLYPDMALQFSHSLADSFRAEGYEQIEVRANVMASLNEREIQHLIVDPTVALAAQPRTLAPAPWILPLEKPLPPPP